MEQTNTPCVGCLTKAQLWLLRHNSESCHSGHRKQRDFTTYIASHAHTSIAVIMLNEF
jgi:hypothetical protein